MACNSHLYLLFAHSRSLNNTFETHKHELASLPIRQIPFLLPRTLVRHLSSASLPPTPHQISQIHTELSLPAELILFVPFSLPSLRLSNVIRIVNRRRAMRKRIKTHSKEEKTMIVLTIGQMRERKGRLDRSLLVEDS